MTITTIILPADFGNDGPRDAAILHQYLEYREGKIFWKVRPSKSVYAGDEVGTARRDGYRTMTIGKRALRVHHAIWLMFKDVWPVSKIDHVNGNSRDDRIENLRDVSQKENSRNQAMHSRNTSGHTGVYWNKRDRYWQASIRVEGKNVHLGRFFEKEKAVEARKSAEILYGYHQNHGRPAFVHIY